MSENGYDGPERRAAGSSVDEFQYLLTHFPGAVSVYDADLVLIAANDLHYQMTGLPKEQMGEGARYSDIVRHLASNGAYGEGDVEEIVADRVEKLRNPPWDFERAQGDRYIKGRVVATPSGGVICCQQDVTEEKETELRLRKLADELTQARDHAEAASRAKSEFLAVMSHEIRTPMNGVLGMAEILANSSLDDRQREFLGVLTDSARALLSIIDDILDFSKIEAGKLELDDQPFNLRESVEDVATLLAAKAAERNVDLTVRYDPTLPEQLIGDPARLRQVITNLVGNAVKFTHRGYVLINVDGEVKDGLARLAFSVTDTGIGIPEEKLGNIFEQFEQVDRSSTRRYGGTGLGLAITRRLVQAMSGEIGVRSTFGEGATFWFRIDLPVAANAVIPSLEATELAGARALIVDDIEVNRTILREQLVSWGMTAIAAKSGQEALAMFEQADEAGAPFNVAIFDFHMPEMDGLELAEKVGDTLGDKAPPIVMLSSASDDCALSARRAGVSRYLLKPARGSQLRVALEEAIARGGAQASPAPAPVAETPPAPSAPQYSPAAPVASAEPSGSSEPPPLAPEPAIAFEPAAGPVQTESSPPEPAPSPSGRARLLVAEDNPVNRAVVRGMLEDLPIDVTIVEDGALAVSAYRDIRPDLVLMDVSMPVMDGYEATQRLRALEKELSWPRTPVIALTAHVLQGDRERCIEAGMDDFLGKPVDGSELRARVAHWLEDDAGHDAADRAAS